MSLVAAVKQLLLRRANVSTVYIDQDCAGRSLARGGDRRSFGSEGEGVGAGLPRQTFARMLQQ